MINIIVLFYLIHTRDDYQYKQHFSDTPYGLCTNSVDMPF